MLVATADIAAGTAWADAVKLMGVAGIPLAIRPATSVSPHNTRVVRGMVALADIPRNQIIVTGLFIDPAVVPIPPTIPAGHVLLSVDAPDDLQPVQQGDTLLISTENDTIEPIRAEVLRTSGGVVSVVVTLDQATTLTPFDQSSWPITIVQ